MATKMTAVQWLEIAVQNKLASEMGPYFQEAFEQAKEMEKEQIQDAYYHGIWLDESKVHSPYIAAEDYYSETYEQ
jgi:hypothetical protein